MPVLIDVASLMLLVHSFNRIKKISQMHGYVANNAVMQVHLVSFAIATLAITLEIISSLFDNRALCDFMVFMVVASIAVSEVLLAYIFTLISQIGLPKQQKNPSQGLSTSSASQSAPSEEQTTERLSSSLNSDFTTTVANSVLGGGVGSLPRRYTTMLFDNKDVKRADEQILSSILSKGCARLL